MSEATGEPVTSAPADSVEGQQWWYLSTTIQPDVIIKADRAEFTDLNNDRLIRTMRTEAEYTAHVEERVAAEKRAKAELASREGGGDDVILRDDGSKVGEPDLAQLQRKAESAVSTDGDELIVPEGQEAVPSAEEAKEQIVSDEKARVTKSKTK